jgi:hypothetical protein
MYEIAKEIMLSQARARALHFRVHIEHLSIKHLSCLLRILCKLALMQFIGRNIE